MWKKKQHTHTQTGASTHRLASSNGLDALYILSLLFDYISYQPTD